MSAAMAYPTLDTHRLHLFQDADSIRARVASIGASLTVSHRETHPLVVGILGGAFVFLADLVRTFEFDCEVDFWRVASYGSSTRSSGRVHETMPMAANVVGRHIIVVEDIVDSGRTLGHVTNILAQRGAASVTVAALLNRIGSKIPVDHVGFWCNPDFVVGYGLDLGGRLRNLPALYYLSPVPEAS